MTRIQLLSVLIYSNRCQYAILKVSLEKVEHNLPVGCVKHCFIALTKCPVLHAISAMFGNARAYTYEAFQVCNNVIIDSWNEYVKFWGMIPTPSALLQLLKGWRTMANKLLANSCPNTVCDCETAFISYVTFEAWCLFPCIGGRCTCGVEAWFFHYGVRYATGVTDTMV